MLHNKIKLIYQGGYLFSEGQKEQHADQLQVVWGGQMDRSKEERIQVYLNASHLKIVTKLHVYKRIIKCMMIGSLGIFHYLFNTKTRLNYLNQHCVVHNGYFVTLACSRPVSDDLGTQFLYEMKVLR